MRMCACTLLLCPMHVPRHPAHRSADRHADHRVTVSGPERVADSAAIGGPKCVNDGADQRTDNVRAHRGALRGPERVADGRSHPKPVADDLADRGAIPDPERLPDRGARRRSNWRRGRRIRQHGLGGTGTERRG